MMCCHIGISTKSKNLLCSSYIIYNSMYEHVASAVYGQNYGIHFAKWKTNEINNKKNWNEMKLIEISTLRSNWRIEMYNKIAMMTTTLCSMEIQLDMKTKKLNLAH